MRVLCYNEGVILQPFMKRRQQGFTLLELTFSFAILAVIVVALLGFYVAQSFLNANTRATLLAMNDATRILEEIRMQNAGCTIPSAVPPPLIPVVYSWDAWLQRQTPSKSLDGRLLETIAVTCQDVNGGSVSSDYCGANQVGLGDQWKVQKLTSTSFDPIRVTVAVGYRLHSRVMGSGSSGLEFTYSPIPLVTAYGSKPLREGPDANNNGVIEAQTMLTTLVTCR